MACVFTLAASSVMSAEGLIHSGEAAVKVARRFAKRVESRPRVFEHHVKGATKECDANVSLRATRFHGIEYVACCIPFGGIPFPFRCLRSGPPAGLQWRAAVTV
jgi:hypothetical protein